MPKKKKETLPTYTILIRTPAGTQTVIETNDIKKSEAGIRTAQGKLPPLHRWAGAADTGGGRADERPQRRRDRADIYPAPREGERGYT